MGARGLKIGVVLEREVGKDRTVRVLCYVANLLTAVIGCLIVIVDSEPQVIFGFALLVLLAVTSPLV